MIKYSYNWYIRQFKESKEQAELFFHSIDNIHFQQRSAQHRWSVAECYDHLIKFGNIYYRNIAKGLSGLEKTTDHIPDSFAPRWFWKKVADFFEPPYTIKLKTISSMEPKVLPDYNRGKLLDEYIDLQNQFINQLERTKSQTINLNAAKIPHPIVSFLKLTISEYYLLAAAHQRRHQWQAEQILKTLKNS